MDVRSVLNMLALLTRCGCQCYSRLFRAIKKHDVRGIPDGDILISKFQFASVAIDSEDRYSVCPLISAVEKLTSRIKAKASRIISTCPFLSHEGEFAGWSNSKNSNAIVETISRVDKLSVI